MFNVPFPAKFSRRSLLIFLLSVLLTAFSTFSPLSVSAQNTTVIYDGFEESELVVGGEEGWREEVCCGNDSLQLVKDPVRAGTQALKVMLKQSDPSVNGGSRAEIRKRTIPADSEQWYAFSVFLPEGFEQDRAVDILAQWHSMPDEGESWRSPMMHLNLKSGNLFVHRRWDSREITENNSPQGTENIDLGAYSIGKWIDFVFHVKWSDSSDGLVEIWKDRALVVTKRGPNAYNDKGGTYAKIGIYKPDWLKYPKKSSTSERTVYFDEVKIGDGNASIKDFKIGQVASNHPNPDSVALSQTSPSSDSNSSNSNPPEVNETDSSNSSSDRIPSESSPGDAERVMLYQHRDFGGKSQSFSLGNHDAARGQFNVVGNNNISSLRVPEGLTAKVCDTEQENCQSYESGNYPYIGDEFNDTASFLEVQSTK